MRIESRSGRSRYYFGRLHIIGGFEGKHEFLFDGLTTANGSQYRGYSWNFFDVEEVRTDDELYLVGYLSRFQPRTDAEVANVEARHIEDRQFDDVIVGRSHFILHTTTGIIAFDTDADRIPLKTFINRFKATFEEGRLMVQVNIETIDERHKVLDDLSRFETLLSISVSLHPSNPRSARRWEAVDKSFHEAGIVKYREQYDAKIDKGGIDLEKLKERTDIEAKVTMAEDGYGKADATGVIEGKVKKISTRDNPISKVVIDDTEDRSGALHELQETFRSIWHRILEE